MNPYQSIQQREHQLAKSLQEIIGLYQIYCPAWLELTKEIDLKQIKNIHDLPKLPIIHKNILPENQQQQPPFGGFRCSASPVWHLYVSPGPIYEYDTQCDDFWGLQQALTSAGVNSDDRIANTFSYHYTPAGMMVDEAAGKLGCQILPAGPGSTKQLIEAINHFQITTYIGTPDFLKIILDKAIESSQNMDSLCKAVVSGGYLSPSIRAQSERAGIAISQCYATADVGLIAYECPEEVGMVCAENIWLEIVNPSTMQPVATGEKGEVVVSRLTTNAPLLRFATGDLSAFITNEAITDKATKPSPSNTRTHLRIQGWLGRSDESVKVKGQFIRPVQIKNLRNQFESIKDMQLQVVSENYLDQLHLYVNAEQSKDLTKQLQQNFREITGLRAEIKYINKHFDSLIKDTRQVVATKSSPIDLNINNIQQLLAKAYPHTRSTIVNYQEGEVKLEQRVATSDLRSGNMVSGPAILELADVAGFCSFVDILEENESAATVNLNMNFLTPCATKKLHCTARLIKVGRRLIHTEALIYDEQLTLCSKSCVVYARFKTKSE